MNCNHCHSTSFTKLPFYYEWNSHRFDVIRCKNCSLITLSRLPNDEELQKLYSEDFFTFGAHTLDKLGIDYETMADQYGLETHKQFIKNYIEPYGTSLTSFFEIGAGMAHFLQAAKELGYAVDGLEIGEVAVRKAKEKFGIELRLGDFETIDLSSLSNSFDCIYAGDVFEHMRDPALVVKKMYEMLRPNGIVVIKIPGTFNLLSSKIASMIFSLTNTSKKLPDKPYHLYEFTTKTISNIFLKKFQEVTVINTIKKPSELNKKTGGIDYAIKYFLQFINYPLTKITNRFGDRMTVIAKKVS